MSGRRPPNWKNPHKDWFGKTSCEMTLKQDYETNQHYSFEDGADEMLKSLRDTGVVMENYQPTNRTVMETAGFLNQCEDGLLVFIPDKKEEE